MKVRATQEVHIRANEPWVKPGNKKGVLYPGFEIEVAKVHSENTQVIQGNGTWYEDKNGDFYWSGGFNRANESLSNEYPNLNLLNYDSMLEKYTELAPSTLVNIGFLDSGINENHPHLKVKEYKSFIDNKSLDGFTSHGNRIAGILSSTDPELKRNNSWLYCFRVIDHNNHVSDQAVIDSLKDINDNYSDLIDVVNLSINVSYDSISQIQPIVDQLLHKNIIIVLSAGENNYENNISFLDGDGVFKVAAFDNQSYDGIKQNGLNDKYDFAFLNTPVKSYSIDGNVLDATISDDSAYTAVVSSLIARVIDNLPKDNNRKKAAKNFLLSIATSIQDVSEPEHFKAYKS